MLVHDKISLGNNLLFSYEHALLFKDDKPPISLSFIELKILYFLSSNMGELVESIKLINYVWGSKDYDFSRLYVAINQLRAKIEDNPYSPKCIVTIRKRGYILYPRV